jgi:hypothetical protein
MIATGTYAGEWTHRNEVVHGDMRLEGSRSPGGEFDAKRDGSRSFSRQHMETVAVLRGRLRSGHDAVLLDARLTHWWPGRTAVRATMVLVGLGLPEGELLFDSVKFQVGGLTELAGVYPLKSVTLPKTLEADAEFSATWNAETATQTWTTDSGDELALEFTACIGPCAGYSLSLTSSPVITVSGAARSVEDWMRQYVRPLAEITTLATLRPQPVCWVTVRHGEEEFPAQLFAEDIVQQPYDAAPTEISGLISHDSGTLIRLGPDGATLPDLLAGWQSLQTTYVTFFDYLTVALRDTMSSKSRFLALVPALEGFHLAKYSDGPVPRNEFQRQRRDVLRRVTALEGLADADAAFLKKWLKEYGSYQLDHRLRELVDRELADGLRNCVRARINPLPEILRPSRRPKDVWAVMSTTRNRIAHGSDNQPSPAQLTALTRLAHTVAIGVALNHLRVPDTVLCAAIDQDTWSLI